MSALGYSCHLRGCSEFDDASNQSVLHFCPSAKYAIAFPEMSPPLGGLGSEALEGGSQIPGQQIVDAADRVICDASQDGA